MCVRDHDGTHNKQRESIAVGGCCQSLFSSAVGTPAVVALQFLAYLAGDMTGEQHPPPEAVRRDSRSRAGSPPPPTSPLEPLRVPRRSSSQQVPPLPPRPSSDDERLIRLALHTNPFFTCLDEEQIQAFIKSARLMSYPPGQPIILEGCVDRDDDDIDDSDDGWDGEEKNVGETDGSTVSSATLSIEIIEGPADAEEEEEVLLEEEEEEEGHLRSDLRSANWEFDDDAHTRRKSMDDSVHESLCDDSKDGDESATNARSPASAKPLTDGPSPSKDPGPSSSQSSETPPSAEALEEERLALDGQGLDDDELVLDPDNDDDEHLYDDSGPVHPPQPPQSSVPRAVYIVRSGRADVYYRHVNPAALGPGTLFGEGGFLFGRPHAASVVASRGGTGHSRYEPLECWVIEARDFRNHVLPASPSMKRLFQQHANRRDSHNRPYLTLADFAQAVAARDDASSSSSEISSSSVASNSVGSSLDPLASLRIANAYHIFQPHPNHSLPQKSTNPNSNAVVPQRIYLPDFCLFHLLMARPDPEVDMAFLLMDRRRTGQIRLDDLQAFLRPVDPDVDFRGEFFRRYFGSDGSGRIRHPEFPQFLGDLQRELGQQAFLRAVHDRGMDGYVDAKTFVRVLRKSCGWRLPPGVSDRLENVYCQSPTKAGEAAAAAAVRAGSYRGDSVQDVVKSAEAGVWADMEQREKNLGMRSFGYGDFLAFQEVLALLPAICHLIDTAQQIKRGPVSPDDFKVASRVLGLGGRLSRRQVDVVFTLFDLDRDGFVSHEDAVSVCGIDVARRLVAVKGRNGLLTFAPPPECPPPTQPTGISASATGAVLSVLQLFGLTMAASSLGVLALSPLELVKTRLMNQRIMIESGSGRFLERGRLYRHSFDCVRQVLRTEGAFGLYRGLTPQLLGVAPEKAIKLQVNQLLRQVFASTTDGGGTGEAGDPRSINLPLEVLAGAGAGACQLLVTNPMEVLKTRLILQGETAQLLRQQGEAPPPSQTLRGMVRELGFPGLYRGALACLLRDIPFSAIYFPAYALCKNALAELHDDDNNNNGSSHRQQASRFDLLAAGTLAGIPAAFFTTPCDVIRLRLQAEPRPGDAAYAGIRDCASQILANEGTSAFFRGATARVLRIAPQFGIALLAYEQFAQGLGVSNAASPPTNAPVDPRDYRTAFPTSALRPKTDDMDGFMRHYGVVVAPSSSSSPSSLDVRRER